MSRTPKAYKNLAQAKFLYAFGVYSSCEHFEPKRMAIGKEAKGNPFRPLRPSFENSLRPSSTRRLGRLKFVQQCAARRRKIVSVRLRPDAHGFAHIHCCHELLRQPLCQGDW